MVEIQRYEDYSLTTDQALALVEESLAARRPFSLVRLGHAEMLVLSHHLAPKEWPMQGYLIYSGVPKFDARVTRRLVNAFKSADIIGLVPGKENRDAPRTKQLLEAYQIVPERVCDAWVTHRLSEDPRFLQLLSRVRLAIVGRRAAEALPALARHGIRPVATYRLEGVQRLDRFLEAARRGPAFDLILISAGVPATIAAPELARRLGVVAIDFGHALDLLIDGGGFNYEKLEAAFLARRRRERLRQATQLRRRTAPAKRRHQR